MLKKDNNRYQPSKRKNPGVHSKSKTSKNKISKNYKKPYNRQGK